MRTSPRPKLLLAAILLALAACQKPDVGGECTLAWADPPVAQPDASCPASGTENGTPCFSVSAEFFESGNIVCENLVCIISPVAAGSKYDRAPDVGYCSKPCVSNDDCFESDTGLVCRQMVLDRVFMERLDDDLREQYLGQINFSSFCGTP